MALSGTRAFIQNRNTIIESALRKVGVVAQGETPTTEQYIEATFALNSMVQSWHSRGIFLWMINSLSVNIFAGTTNHVILGDDILDILNPRILIDSNSIPLTILTRVEYMNISNPALSGMMASIYIHETIDKITIFFYPTPNTNCQLLLDIVSRAQDFNLSSDNPDFPIEWGDALIYGLASRLSSEYQLPLQERKILFDEAELYFREALAGSKESGSLQFSPRR